jgi:hypothetical protein
MMQEKDNASSGGKNGNKNVNIFANVLRDQNQVRTTFAADPSFPFANDSLHFY